MSGAVLAREIRWLTCFPPRDVSRGQRSVFSAFSKNQVTLASVSPEYQEVEFYYTHSIDVDLKRWEELDQEGFVPEETQNLMKS